MWIFKLSTLSLLLILLYRAIEHQFDLVIQESNPYTTERMLFWAKTKLKCISTNLDDSQWTLSFLLTAPPEVRSRLDRAYKTIMRYPADRRAPGASFCNSSSELSINWRVKFALTARRPVTSMTSKWSPNFEKVDLESSCWIEIFA